ncbi:MAG: methionine gamma-lyase family protein [Oscillospiraceae bacterium]|nr:methionine gamma-lyase family protein [Oscillospiraceae bacterium]
MLNPEFYNIPPELAKTAAEAEETCSPIFKKIDKIRDYNSQKMLKAFTDKRISEAHLHGSNGYGYGDRSRDNLDQVAAQVFGGEDALVRYNFVSGTHAIGTALNAVLRPGETMLCISGRPYDTLLGVIGLEGRKKPGTLLDLGVIYRQIELLEDGALDESAILAAVREKPAVVYLQRSRGYSLRPSVSISTMKNIFGRIRQIHPEVKIIVDNCYGEFIETREPTQAGADLIIGSLIKNPGGGIAETGGYIAGRADLIELCACRLATPATGREVGCTLDHGRALYMGFFLAPNVAAEALKTAVFAARLYERLGYEVFPRWDEDRTDIIQAIKLGAPEKLIAFCEAIQGASPVDSFVRPEPWDMPGYSDKVIMAAGTFTMGASIELSADAPLREPFAVWMQGGLTYASAKIAVVLAARKIMQI